MTTATRLPGLDQVGSLMQMLLGRDVTAAAGAAVALDGSSPAVLAAYRTEDGQLGALIGSDLERACFAGAALSMVPSGVAAEAVASGELPENLMENFHEVLNIASRWFNGAGNPRLILAEVLTLGHDAAPDDIAQALAQPAERTDFSVNVDGYGSGSLALLPI